MPFQVLSIFGYFCSDSINKQIWISDAQIFKIAFRINKIQFAHFYSIEVLVESLALITYSHDNLLCTQLKNILCLLIHKPLIGVQSIPRYSILLIACPPFHVSNFYFQNKSKYEIFPYLSFLSLNIFKKVTPKLNLNKFLIKSIS